MFRRRPEIDPETARLIEQRLENLLFEPPARKRLPDPTPSRGAAASQGPAASRAPTGGAPRRLMVDDLSVPVRKHGADPPDTPDQPDTPDSPIRAASPGRWASLVLNRAQLGVVAVLALLALLGAGWVVLRARPVAVATPLPTASAISTTSVSRSAATTTPSATASPTKIVVHVLGAVRRPGLVTVADRARVNDAITAAGGLRRDADPGELNLARPVSDGEQIVIGTRSRPAGEVRSGDSGTSSDSGTGTGGGGGAGTMVDLNRASQAQLEQLPGVGPVTATKILAWRREHGRFSRVEELQEVSGIGPKTYAEIAPHCRV